MTYFAEPNYIAYDLWFDSNINPVDLIDNSDEKEFSNFINEKFNDISSLNIFIGASQHKQINIFPFF